MENSLTSSEGSGVHLMTIGLLDAAFTGASISMATATEATSSSAAQNFKAQDIPEGVEEKLRREEGEKISKDWMTASIMYPHGTRRSSGSRVTKGNRLPVDA